MVSTLGLKFLLTFANLNLRLYDEHNWTVAHMVPVGRELAAIRLERIKQVTTYNQIKRKHIPIGCMHGILTNSTRG